MRSLTLFLLLLAFATPLSHSQEPPSDESSLKARIVELEDEITRLKHELQTLKREQTNTNSAHPVAAQLNGRWLYVSVTEGETSTQYDDKTTMELVIHGDKWTTLIDNAYMASDTHIVEYNFDAKPISLVRSAPDWAPGSIARAVLEIDGDQLIYTTTAFENPNEHPLSAYTGSSETTPKYPLTPSQLDPTGTRNTRYTLRRVGRTTTLPKLQQFGGGAPGF
ncbi:MAG: hypothetical protein WBM40_07065 [Thiohalocapsa sp.]